MINAAFRGVNLRDTRCGFKAISRECAQALLPYVQDTGWFWDTELLLLAAKGGWRVHYVPVRWQEDTDSRVKLPQLLAMLQRPPGEGAAEGEVPRLFTIAYGEEADKDALQRISKASGGQIFDASDPDKIDQVFASVINNF